MIVRSVLLIAALVVGAACARTPDASTGGPQEVLAATAANLGEIRSATIAVELVAETRDGRGRVGFRLDGPLQLADEGDLPVAELTYTQIAGPHEGEGRFTSTGEEVFVTIDGTTTPLADEQADQLRQLSAGSRGPIQQLDVSDWVVDPSLQAGDGTDTVRGQLRVTAFYADLAELTGGALPPLSDGSAARLREAVSSSTIEVATGAEDRLLRRVVIDLVVGPEAPDDVPGLAKGAEVHFELRLSDVNRPVEVDAAR